jgi:hypothetical protein
MPTKPRVVTLTQRERKALEDFVGHGTKSARAITRARILGEFWERKSPHQLGAAGRMRISHLGNSECRSSRSSTTRMAFLLRVTPRGYSL